MNISRVVAREGLIVLAIFGILNYAGVRWFSKMDFPAPLYRLSLTDGSSMYLPVYPEMNPRRAPGETIERMYRPTADLVDKRVKEFAALNKLNVVSWYPVRSWQEMVTEYAAYFVALNIVVQAGMLYFLILTIRFVLWACKTLFNQ